MTDNQGTETKEISESPGSEHPAARLKGVGDSLWITLDPTVPIPRLEKELATILAKAGSLAQNARVVLDTGNGESDMSLIESLGNYLKQAFQVAEVRTPGTEREGSQTRVRQRDLERSWQNYGSDVLMLAGKVRSGQRVSARKHLVVLGDVNPGADISAGGDIVVLGKLRGKAAAGQSAHGETSVIIALDFKPTQIRIAGFVAAGSHELAVSTAEIAQVEDGAIVVRDYLKSNPFGRLPWPKVR